MNIKSKRTMENKAGYDLWAPIYDAYPNPTVALDDLCFPSYWQHLKFKNILEIGCGTGRHTHRIQNNGNKVTAIDLSSEMLRIARTKLKSGAVEFIEGDFMKLNHLRENNFDAVISSLVIEHIACLDEFFLKVNKILKIGGEVYLSEVHPARAADGKTAHFKMSKDEIYLTSFRHEESQIAHHAANAGFEKIKCTEILGNEALAQVNQSWQRYLNVPMIKIWILKKIIVATDI